MALNDLHEFLIALSKHKTLREAFDKDPKGVGIDAGLTGTEIDLLKANNEDDIRKYLGQEFSDASMIHVKP
ncbi:MAG: hypothetical protein ABIV06_02535 [Thermoanaerobaculia bacterium]